MDIAHLVVPVVAVMKAARTDNVATDIALLYIAMIHALQWSSK